MRARRAALAHDLGRPLVWMRQTHSTEVVVLRRPDGGSRDGNTPTREQGDVPADGVVVDARGWSDAPGAAVMVADCLPVLLADDSGQVVAAVHAGRAGLEGGILTRAVSVMAELVGGPSTLHALIGHSICGRCYEVPAEMRERVSAGHPASWSTTSWGTPALDLPAGAEEELLGLGWPRSAATAGAPARTGCCTRTAVTPAAAGRPASWCPGRRRPWRGAGTGTDGCLTTCRRSSGRRAGTCTSVCSADPQVRRGRWQDRSAAGHGSSWGGTPLRTTTRISTGSTWRRKTCPR
ncbi:laccase domain-containing protein [Actinomyces polynesiensis]|uniref:laccase domain-containing protein n=1 Tax=Actinomyces polynesiensis TaxID=1325934 RepID=UPI002F3E8AE1